MNLCLTKTLDFNGDVLALTRCFTAERHLCLLESSYPDSFRGRYSFIGFDPFLVLRAEETDILQKLQAYYQPFHEIYSVPSTPFPAGVMGYLSYDYGLYQHGITSRNANELNLPDGFFGFYDVILTVDHFENKLHITSTGLPEKNLRLREKRAHDRLLAIANHLKKLNDFDPLDFSNIQVEHKLSIRSNLSQEQYMALVKKALEYIAAGDIYQLNLAQRFHAKLNGQSVDALTVYNILRQLSPAPFAGYMDAGDHQLISSSPERFLSLSDGVVRTRPMKGTRPRGTSPIDDAQQEKELCESHKDQAELLMITDLMRNDLGRVCEFGSITVKAMRNIEVYKNIFQATSAIEGKLRASEDMFSLLRACFPGGSITGCPKIRAMQIIDELEPSRRGPYTGSMGYFSFNGHMDSNILIRTLLLKDSDVYFQAGSGIVADSMAQNEYNETLVKAEAMMKALEIALQLTVRR